MLKMTLFFNLHTLEEDTLCDPIYMVVALHKFYKGQKFPKNSRETYKPLTRLKAGSSYLLNPADFFDDKGSDPIHKAHYIRLAGRRDYQLYKQYGIKSLDLTLYPDLDLRAVSSNPLLTIANKQLHFKYER